MAISEAPLVDAALMAIAEINQAGGVRGQRLQAQVEDGASHPDIFADRVHHLITNHRAATLFGGWTSASRKAMLPELEAANVLLWYPIQYEGLEQSPNVFYTGMCPNQQVEPAVRWLVSQGWRRIYLLGSDYVFPRTVNRLIEAQLRRLGGSVVQERYVNLEETDLTSAIADIAQSDAEAVFSTLNGCSNVAFYQQYAAAGLSADTLPILAISIAESELQQIGPAATGHYASWSYFQSLNTPENHRFVTQFQQRYGSERVTSDPIATAYAQVHLWAQAVEAAQSFESDRVRQAAIGQRFLSPGGWITLGENHHVHRPCRIGQIQANGQLHIVRDTQTPIAPLPWLGVEQTPFANASVVIELLSDVSSWIQKAQVLEQTLERLTQEMRDRAQAEAALRDSQTQLARTQTELELTHRLQKALLPPEEELAQIEALEIAGVMEPAVNVGGDYYDVIPQGDRLYITIGDVTGHGLSSGMIMLMVQAAIRALLKNGEIRMERILAAANRMVYENTQRMGSPRQMSLAILDYGDRHLQIWGQHETVIVLRQDGSIEPIDTVDLGFPLGLEPDITPFIQTTQIELRPGDGVVLYSDGIVEAMNPANEQYGLRRLYAVLQQHAQSAASEIRDAILADVHQHRGTQTQFDDLTVLILKQR
jgi:urea ABC transporter urea binding protein